MFKKNLTLVITVLCGLFCQAQKEITDKDADSLLLVNNNRLIVLDFYATWCGPCKIMDPLIKELEAKYKDKVDFYKMDVDKNKADETLGISALPSYLFIKNSTSIGVIEGVTGKQKMEALIREHMRPGCTITAPSTSNHSSFDVNNYNQENIDAIWDSSSKLNSLAWNAYKNHNDRDILLKALQAAERSISLEKNYYNLDTYAALLYKTGNYSKAYKNCKQAIQIAKDEAIDSSVSVALLEKIKAAM